MGIDRRDAAPLKDIHRGLDVFGEEVVELQDRIARAVAYWASREKQQQGDFLADKNISYVQKEIEVIDCNADNFDPRRP